LATSTFTANSTTLTDVTEQGAHEAPRPHLGHCCPKQLKRRFPTKDPSRVTARPQPITSSARARSAGGIAKPSAFADVKAGDQLRVLGNKKDRKSVV